MKKRASGVLMHITSLPSAHGIGDLGPAGGNFVRLLAEARQSFWQILPLNPTDPQGDYSPYYSFSAFGGNPMLVSPERLVEDGYLEPEDLPEPPGFPPDRVDYEPVSDHKSKILETAYRRFRSRTPSPSFERFRRENSDWLEDFVRFSVLKEVHGGASWDRWPDELRDRDPEALEKVDRDHREGMERLRFFQFLFQEQWRALRWDCNRNGIQLIGDIPIYVNHDSADVWAHRELFDLGRDGRPSVVSGVPPDYFSATGQLWGHPVYRWDALKERGYDWWIRRMERNLDLFDWVRVDHFRGLVAYWEVPAGETTAMNGRWVEAPAVDFLNSLLRRFSALPIIAEDLGYITPDVREVIRRFDLPGMRLLLFAFGEDLPENPYAPHNHIRNCVVYTGTHDNNTARGWYENEADPEDRRRLRRYVGRFLTPEEVPGEMVRMAMRSPANLAVLPIQDLLGLGEEARMNRPAHARGNWRWRVSPDHLTGGFARRLAEWTEIYGRV